MKQKAQVVMLPTEEKTAVIKFNISNELYFLREYKNKDVKSINAVSQHLYFTVPQTTELPKLGDYVYHEEFGIRKVVTDNEVVNDYKYGNTCTLQAAITFHVKVVATTDKSLTREHDDTVPYPKTKSTGIALISQQFQEDFCKAGGIWKVEVEYKHKHNKETRAVWGDDFIQDSILPNVNSNNEIIIHLPKPKLYTKEEVNTIIEDAVKWVLLAGDEDLEDNDINGEPPYVCYDSINIFVEALKKNFNIK